MIYFFKYFFFTLLGFVRSRTIKKQNIFYQQNNLIQRSLLPPTEFSMSKPLSTRRKFTQISVNCFALFVPVQPCNEWNHSHSRECIERVGVWSATLSFLVGVALSVGVHSCHQNRNGVVFLGPTVIRNESSGGYIDTHTKKQTDKRVILRYRLK